MQKNTLNAKQLHFKCDLVRLSEQEFCIMELYHTKVALNLFYNFTYLIAHLLLKEKRVLLWGASKYLSDMINVFPLFNPNIVGIVDKNPKFKGTYIKKYPIFMPDEIQNLNINKIYLTIINNADIRKKEIEEFLKEKELQNITIEKIFL